MTSGSAHEHLGSGLHAMQHESGEHDGGGAGARNAKGEQRNDRPADRSGGGGLRRHDAFRDAAPHVLPAPPVLRLEAIGQE